MYKGVGLTVPGYQATYPGGGGGHGTLDGVLAEGIRDGMNERPGDGVSVGLGAEECAEERDGCG
jgi:hypothetical protein